MRCSDALDVIDANGLVSVSHTRQTDVLAHIAICGACSAALETSRTLEADLRTTGVPPGHAPPTLRPSVMARITRIDVPDAARQPVAGRPPRVGWLESVAVSCMVVGLTVVGLAVSTGQVPASATGTLPEPLVALARTSPTVVILGGLACYVIGLIAPVTRRRHAWRDRH